MIKNIWFDFTNTPHVHFLLAIQRTLEEQIDDFIYSSRDFSETLKLLKIKIPNEKILIINSTYGKNYFSKILSIIERFSKIRKNRIHYDLSISCGSEAAIWYSWLIGKKSIAFGDNDTARQWTYGNFVDFAFFPNAIDKEILEKQGLKNKLFQYNGYKEDIYISFYTPNKQFKNIIPFENYIVVRPENFHANYLRNLKINSIVPLLLKQLSNKGYKIVYLPRYSEDYVLADGISNIHIPEAPLNGLDLCYYSNAVLTGAGTLAREAACLGIPSCSFYAGKKLLAVDRELITQNKIYYSRNINDILHWLKSTNKLEPCLSRTVTVRQEVKEKLTSLIKNW